MNISIFFIILIGLAFFNASPSKTLITQKYCIIILPAMIIQAFIFLVKPEVSEDIYLLPATAKKSFSQKSLISESSTSLFFL